MSEFLSLDEQFARVHDDNQAILKILGELVNVLAKPLVVPPTSGGYDFKGMQETLWAVGVAAGTFALQALTDVDKVTDWRTWAVSVGAGALRAAGGKLKERLGPPPAAGGGTA